MIYRFVFLAFFALISTAALDAAPGTLDWSFGQNGRSQVNIFEGDDANDVAIQQDGKIVVAGTSGSLGLEFSLTRLNTDGSIDLTFGNGGKVRTAFDAFQGRAQAWCMGIQPDGKIVLGGTYSPPGIPFRLAAARYMPDGSLDPSFGTQGKVDIDVGRVNFVNDLVFQPDGKILLTGVTPFEGFLAVRLQPNGLLDTTFAGDGTAIYPPVTSDGQPYAIALQPDGKIILGGYAHIGGSNNVDFALMRLTPDGQLDPTFDGDGKVTTPVGPHPSQDMVSSLVIQSDGKIVAAGYNLNTGFAIARYHSDGSLDTSFGSNGTVLTAVGLSTALIIGMDLQPDGKIVVSGVARTLATRGDFVVARLNPNGTYDQSFGDRGISITAISQDDDNGRRLALQADGKVVVAGYSSGDFVVARYLVHGDRVADFDGDLRSDLSIYHPETGTWRLMRSRLGGTITEQLGDADDQPVPADYDGDGRVDIATFKPETGTWQIINSSTGVHSYIDFGLRSDTPTPGDFDGDGKADIGVFRPQDGTWRLLRSTLGEVTIPFGGNGDLPVVGDFDGDGRSDLAVFSHTQGSWRVRRASGGEEIVNFGSLTDKLAPGDYDGDGKTDMAFYRPSEGVWHIRRSIDTLINSITLGVTTDIPSPADFDGDGRVDTAVFRPSNGSWIISRSTAGPITLTFGQNGDIPIPSVSVRVTMVEISGRVLTPDGRGVRNAIVSLIDHNGIRRTASTSSFGIYSFDKIRVGEQYTLAITSKRYRFTPQVRQFENSLNTVDFVGLE